MGIFRHTEEAATKRRELWDIGMTPEINHHSWQSKGNGVYCRCGRRSDPPKEGFHVSTPHPTRHGYRIYWLFLPVAGMILASCIVWAALNSGLIRLVAACGGVA